MALSTDYAPVHFVTGQADSRGKHSVKGKRNPYDLRQSENKKTISGQKIVLNQKRKITTNHHHRYKYFRIFKTNLSAMLSFLHQINPAYFWDVELNKLDEKKSKRLIIERIAGLGNLTEIKLMIKHYGKQEVIKTLCNLNYLDPKTLNFFSLMFHIPKTEFKCYTRKLSRPQHWDY